jgi:hypothetical protein
VIYELLICTRVQFGQLVSATRIFLVSANYACLGHLKQLLTLFSPRSFLFQKKFFWFGSEPVEAKHLASYLRGEKPDAANHNVAWASHTGKGLLFFSKKASEKSSPAGVLNLSEVSDITEEGTVDFFFKIGEHKHTFQTGNLSERDNWVSVLKTKVAEAKDLKESVTGSEAYKNSHSALSKPVVAAATIPKKSTELKKEEKADAKEEKKEEKVCQDRPCRHVSILVFIHFITE